MAIALLTHHLVPYRIPLYERLARSHGVEVLLYGGGERYMPSGVESLDAQIARAAFPARRLDGPRGAFTAARDYDAVIAPYAGGAVLPAAYLGARRYGKPFVMWASVWTQPRSVTNLAAAPLTRRIYRDADAVVAYGEHARRYVAGIRGHDEDIFIAWQSVEPELFGRPVADAELAAFREEHGLGDGPLVLYAGRLVAAKGIDVLAAAWRRLAPRRTTLVVAGDGPAAGALPGTPRVAMLGRVARERLPVAYAAASVVVVPSISTPRFREPWGLVVNEAMHQGRAVIATDAVGAAAGGLVRDGATGLVIPEGDEQALAAALERLLTDGRLRSRLGEAGRAAVAAYNYDAMAEGFSQALTAAFGRRGSLPD